MKQLYIDQDGFVDFQKNRESYRRKQGITELSANEIDSKFKQHNVEDEFVNIDDTPNPG